MNVYKTLAQKILLQSVGQKVSILKVKYQN